MQMEQARGFVFQALRGKDWNQYENLVAAVGHIKAKADNINLNQFQYYGADGRQFLTDAEKTLIREIIWSLIVQGILIAGLNDSNQLWPFLSLTEYGKRCIEEERVLPHDPEGFLRDFHAAVPNADSTTLQYLTESLQCYIHGLYNSAAVMLGAASEQSVLLLFESYLNSIADPSQKQTFESSLQKIQSIFRKFELFERKFSSVKPAMPRELTENVDSQLRGIFDLIRNSRNDAGHPAIQTFASRDAVYSHLKLFTPYCKRIHGLMEWFDTNST